MRVAVISNPLIGKLGPGDYFHRGLSEIVEAEHFSTGEEVKGYDHYFYVDDGPSYYDAPKFHPASYLAIDFVIPHVWFVNSPEVYINRMRNFDYSYVFSSASQRYCQEQGLNTRLIGFAADPNFHRYYPEVERVYDWVAIWHNCENRPYAVDAAMAKYPNGWVAWRGNGPKWEGEHDYAYYMNMGRCALNYPRANIVNMRVYEVMAMNIPLITMRVDDMGLMGFREDEDYLGFDTIDEMVEKIGLINNFPNKAKNMAKNAQELVLNHHTYHQRAWELINNIF